MATAATSAAVLVAVWLAYRVRYPASTTEWDGSGESGFGPSFYEDEDKGR